MNWLELFLKIAPYAFWVASLIFMISAAFHIKHLREKEQQDEIALKEMEIDNQYNHYGDTDVLNEFNKLESPSDPDKKD